VSVAAGLLLAAGAGRRFGGTKALVEFDGLTFVERGVALLREGGCSPTVVVVGAASESVGSLVRAKEPDTQIVAAQSWAEGLGASLRAGLEALAATDSQMCVVALVDQPLVGVEAVRRLIQASAASGADAAVATYGGVPRNPVLLSRRIWLEVAAAASGDVGARSWLTRYPERVVKVSCDGTGRPDDVDVPGDLAALAGVVQRRARGRSA
jgi:CTP:molybdopterin cytidylyltransferase MocA